MNLSGKITVLVDTEDFRESRLVAIKRAFGRSRSDVSRGTKKLPQEFRSRGTVSRETTCYQIRAFVTFSFCLGGRTLDPGDCRCQPEGWSRKDYHRCQLSRLPCCR